METTMVPEEISMSTRNDSMSLSKGCKLEITSAFLCSRRYPTGCTKYLRTRRLFFSLVFTWRPIVAFLSLIRSFCIYIHVKRRCVLPNVRKTILVWCCTIYISARLICRPSVQMCMPSLSGHRFHLITLNWYVALTLFCSSVFTSFVIEGDCETQDVRSFGYDLQLGRFQQDNRFWVINLVQLAIYAPLHSCSGPVSIRRDVWKEFLVSLFPLALSAYIFRSLPRVPYVGHCHLHFPENCLCPLWFLLLTLARLLVERCRTHCIDMIHETRHTDLGS